MFPLFDYIMGTRVKYFDTEEYYLDFAKRSCEELKDLENEKDI